MFANCKSLNTKKGNLFKNSLLVECKSSINLNKWTSCQIFLGMFFSYKGTLACMVIVGMNTIIMFVSNLCH